MKTVDGNSCPRSSERCPPSIGTLSGFNRNRCPQSSESAEIAKIMMDEAILALMAESLSLSDIQAAFKKYTKRDLPRFYMDLKKAASDQGGH